MAEQTYLSPGAFLSDRYEIAEEIGRGGYSVVYRARDRRIGGDVAIKLLVPPPAAARLARERLRREVLAVRQLQHPNIVTVYDVEDSGPWSFVVMALVNGADLAVRVRTKGPLDPAAAAHLGRDIATALDAAHTRGIVHRDVKPQNILLGTDGKGLLTDFGSARLAGQVTLTQTGGMVGTLAFAAPEVAAGIRTDGRADIYALGLTIYYALTGELPSRGSSIPQAKQNGFHVRECRAEVPSWLDAAIARATAADPDDRFPSAALLALALSDQATETGPATTGLRDRCALCCAADPFGLGVCGHCARNAIGEDDVLVFLDRTSPGSPRHTVLDALETRVGNWSGSGAREAAARGERPLLRIPAGAGPRVTELLEAGGLPSHVENVPAAWRARIPTPISVLSGVVAVAGVLAGFAASAPFLLWTSPAMGAGLVLAVTIGRRTPIWNPPRAQSSTLGAEAARIAARTLVGLPRGQARRLLLDLLRRAGTSTSATADLSALIMSACAAAQDLAALEQHLDAFDREWDRMSDPPEGWMDALNRCEQGRDLLTQRLLGASAALSRWQASVRSTGSGDDLGQLARSLEEDARIQAEAAREIDLLLQQ